MYNVLLCHLFAIVHDLLASLLYLFHHLFFLYFFGWAHGTLPNNCTNIIGWNCGFDTKHTFRFRKMDTFFFKENFSFERGETILSKRSHSISHTYWNAKLYAVLVSLDKLQYVTGSILIVYPQHRQHKRLGSHALWSVLPCLRIIFKYSVVYKTWMVAYFYIRKV